MENPRGEPPMRVPNGEPLRSPEEPHVNMNMRPDAPPADPNGPPRSLQ